MDATKAANLARAVGAVSPSAWELAGDEAGYGTTQDATLGMLSQCAQMPFTENDAFVENMIREIVMKLPMGEQARYNNAGSVPSPSIDMASERYSYGEAFADEMSSIGAAGVGIGETILSPVTGALGAASRAVGTAAENIGKGLTPVIIVAALAVIGVLLAYSKAK